jgi:Trk K+ transport system NAD-binding subunit
MPLKKRSPIPVQLDATDELAVAGLPLKETDIVIIAIGEDQGANVMATALFKNMQVKTISEPCNQSAPRKSIASYWGRRDRSP